MYIYMLREKERGVSAIFHSLHYQKNKKVKVSFSSKRHGKFPQIILHYGCKKLWKAPSECVFQVRKNQSQQYTEVR